MGLTIPLDIYIYIYIFFFFFFFFFFFYVCYIIQLTPQELSAMRMNRSGADGASSGQKTRGCIEGEDPAVDGNIFLFFISHVVHTPQQQSAERETAPAPMAPLMARRPEVKSREKTRLPPVSVSGGSSP